MEIKKTIDDAKTVIAVAGRVDTTTAPELEAGLKLEGGETIYRMASLSLEETLPTAADFTLPDGTVLYTPE